MAKKLSNIPIPVNFQGESHGTYYARKRINGFAIYHSSFKGGKRQKDIKVEKLAYKELGIRLEWTFEQARARCAELNKEKSLIKGKARRAASRVTQLTSINSILFDADRVALFSKRLEQENQGTDYHLSKVHTHFLKVQALVTDLELLPHQYKENEKIIYKWFATNRVSLDYTQKLISLLNRWGHFVSRINGQFFEPIKPVRGIARERIREAHVDKEGVRKKSPPLSPELLEKKKDRLSTLNYNFLFCTVWLGLRPWELKELKEVVLIKNKEGLDHLKVYQSKLVTLPKDQRYKYIPIVLPQQKLALKIIESQDYKAPIYKTLHSVFGPKFGLYAGRNGFVDLMLSEGYILEEISLWMGHTSIDTTWSHYKIKNVLALQSPKKR